VNNAFNANIATQTSYSVSITGYLEVEDDGVNHYYRYSRDGNRFIDFAQTANTNIAATGVGVMLLNNTTDAMWLHVEWFRKVS
jgi:hypothetical protein